MAAAFSGRAAAAVADALRITGTGSRLRLRVDVFAAVSDAPGALLMSAPPSRWRLRQQRISGGSTGGICTASDDAVADAAAAVPAVSAADAAG